LEYVYSVLVLALLLGVLVVVHEFGHYAVSRLAGMKVHEFAFGFGPIIARLFRRGDTEFNIRIVPLGGFVRIAGMEPGEDDVAGGFNSAPVWHRLLVVLAGPFMSLVLGYIVFLAIGFIWGFAADTPSTRVDMVRAKTPAARVGLRPGDVIVAINGKPLTNGGEMLKIIRSSAGKELTLAIRRGDRPVILRVTPELGSIPGLKGKVGQIGFVPDIPMVHTGVIESVKRGTIRTFQIAAGIVTTIFSKKIATDVGGLVFIGYMTGEMVKAGPEAVIFELGALSVMLGILNLIPWPVLDGGHIVYLALEKIRGKRLEPERWYAVQMVGLAVLVALAVFLVYYDISRIVTGKALQ